MIAVKLSAADIKPTLLILSKLTFLNQDSSIVDIAAIAICLIVTGYLFHCEFELV
jgi:hypothetical protein